MKQYDISVYPKSFKGVAKCDIPSKIINKSIASHRKSVKLKELAELIENKYVWTPATFVNGEKRAENVESMQLFAIDIDGGLEYSEALKRAEKYCLPVALSYETLSSVTFSKYRLVFACNDKITDKPLIQLMLICFCIIFHEADKTSKDMSKMYYPGNNARYSEESFFSVYDLLLSTMQYLSENDNEHKTRTLKQLAAKTGVALNNNAFYITEPYNMKDYCCYPEENNLKNIVIHDSLNNPYYLLFGGNKANLHFVTPPPKLKNVNFDDMECCQLMADFSSGVRLKHLEWLGLMTNLIYLKGGQQFFKDTLEKYEEKYGDISRKFEQMSWAKKNNCHSYRCDSYCPYDDVCSHGSNMCYTVTSREVRKIHEDIEYTDLETMRKNISDAITESMKNSGINVIKAPTGAGKTYAYLQAVLNSEKRCIVAVPTSRLMREIAEKACLMGVKTICTPLIHELLSHLDNELSDYINYLYSIGDDGGINYLLRENRNFYVDNYLNQIENLRRFDGKLIVTTHARLLNMKADFLNARNVIIDEDILPFMMQIERCSVQDLENLQFSLYNAEIKPDEHIYSKLSEIQKVNGYEILKPMNYDITNEDKFAVNCCINSKNWTSNIYHALYAECFYHAENSDDILFLNVRTLPESAFTIVSATADEMIYRNIFGDRISYFYDLGMVKNTGKLILHCDKSYSHDCLLNEPEIIDNLRKKHSDCNIITFREFAQKNEVYLGASHGFNKFEGENLAVMGTFHRPEYVYKLWAMYMTGSTSFCGDVLAVRNIRRNGFSFKIMTYKEELLRNIQLWMIQSESEQAVGRARLLNNDCTVHLYSNLPLRQGELYG